MTIADLIALLSAQNWLPLSLLLVVYARKLCSTESSFPLTIDAQWVTAFGGLVYGFGSQLSHGVFDALLAAVIAASVGGLGDGFLTAIFNHDKAPKWARVLVGVFEDVAAPAEGATGPAGPAGATGPKGAAGATGPAATKKRG
jgi:hypothetical protein